MHAHQSGGAWLSRFAISGVYSSLRAVRGCRRGRSRRSPAGLGPRLGRHDPPRAKARRLVGRGALSLTSAKQLATTRCESTPKTTHMRREQPPLGSRGSTARAKRPGHIGFSVFECLTSVPIGEPPCSRPFVAPPEGGSTLSPPSVRLPGRGDNGRREHFRLTRLSAHLPGLFPAPDH
jgi:hypothetical protein